MNHYMINKILIIRLSSIGDIILTTPVVKEIRSKFPDARLDYIIKKRFADIIRHNPYINNLIEFDETEGFKALSELKKDIKNEKYDLIIDIHNNLRSKYLKTFSGAKTVRTFNKEYAKRTLLVKFKKNLYGNNKGGSTSISGSTSIRGIISRFFDCISDLVKIPEVIRPEIYIPDHIEFSIIEEFFSDSKSGAGPNVVLIPGAGFPTKEWPVENFAEAGNILKNDYNAKIYIIGGKNDTGKGKVISNKLNGECFDLTGQCILLETAAVIKHCDFVITNDTGGLHMAWAFNKITAAVFGPTVRELGYYPDNGNTKIIEKVLDCRPCTHNGTKTCPKKHFKCMKDIDVKDVLDTVKVFIN